MWGPIARRTCLRSNQSVGAEKASAPVPSYSNVVVGGFSGVSAPTPKEKAWISFCMNDQITESFADWLSSEVVPDYIARNFPQLSRDQFRIGYSNAGRGSCEMSNSNGADPHPTQEKRINRILLVQPKIRVQMGCPLRLSDRKYCKVDGTEAAVGGTPASDGKTARGAK